MAGEKQGSNAAHAELVKLILVAIGASPKCRVWSNNTGIGRSLNSERIIHFGLKGSSDIIGLTCDGKILCLEVKTGKAIQSKAQKNFQKMIEKFGGRYYVIRSVEQVKTIIEEEICLKKN